jgi:hypothetical protein
MMRDQYFAEYLESLGEAQKIDFLNFSSIKQESSED